MLTLINPQLVRLHSARNGEQITLHHPDLTNAHFILIDQKSALFFTGNDEPGFALDGLDLAAFINQWLGVRLDLAGQSSAQIFQTLKTKFFSQAA